MRVVRGAREAGHARHNTTRHNNKQDKQDKQQRGLGAPLVLVLGRAQSADGRAPLSVSATKTRTVELCWGGERVQASTQPPACATNTHTTTTTPPTTCT